MTDIDETIDDVREAAAGFLNADGRSAGHVAFGIAATVGFALLATALASGAIKPPRRTAAQAVPAQTPSSSARARSAGSWS